MKKQEVLQELKGYIGMLFGCIAFAISATLFLANNSIVSGGMTGLAILLNQINNKLPIGIMSIVLNLPILLLATRFHNIKFIVRCLITFVTLGLIMELFSGIPPVTDDGVLASLYGGILQGIGIGLFIKFEFSSGGTELLGRILHRFFKFFSIPLCAGILDGIIVILGAVILKNPSNLLHALIVIFVNVKVSEIVLMGLEKSKLCIIITDKGAEISEALLEKSPRGITMLDGQGMYLKKERNVLLTCVKNRQLTQLKQIVKNIDENAFIIINESAEVRGKGFQSLAE